MTHTWLLVRLKQPEMPGAPQISNANQFWCGPIENEAPTKRRKTLLLAAEAPSPARLVRSTQARAA